MILDAIGIIPKSRSQRESDPSLSLVTGSESAKAAKCDTSTFQGQGLVLQALCESSSGLSMINYLPLGLRYDSEYTLLCLQIVHHVVSRNYTTLEMRLAKSYLPFPKLLASQGRSQTKASLLMLTPNPIPMLHARTEGHRENIRINLALIKQRCRQVRTTCEHIVIRHLVPLPARRIMRNVTSFLGAGVRR